MAKPHPMQLDDLFKLKAVGRVALAPDERRVVFELKHLDLPANRNRVQLMVVEVAGGEPRPLTDGQHVDIRPRWSPDGQRLAFLSNREKKITALWVLPMDGGPPLRLTDLDGNVSDFCWSPDGRRIAYTYQSLNARQKLERDEKHDEVKKLPQFKHITRLHHKLDGAGWWNGEYTHVYVVSSRGGKPRRLTHGEYDQREPRFSPDGRKISFVSNRAPDRDRFWLDIANVYVVSPSGGAARRITQTRGVCQFHSWSPDGRWIAYIGNPCKPGEWYKYNEHVWIVPSTGGKPRELTRQIDNHCMNVTLGDVTGAAFEGLAPIWSGPRLIFHVSEHGATRLYSVDLRGRDLRCELGGDVNVMFCDQAQPGGPIAVTLGTATEPGEVHLLSPANGHDLRQLTHVNAAVLSRISVSTPEPFRVRSDNVEVHGWVLHPPGFNPRRKYPAILQIHGGPTAQYGYSMFHEMQFLAARGYVVAFSNPRGSSGYGLKFQRCIHGDWGKLDYRDVMRVADWLFTRPYVDRQRVGVTGGSYGGFMTNWLLGHTDRFRAAVTQRSVVNMESMFGTSDFGFAFGYELGGMPWKNVEVLRRQSPLRFVQNIKTPLLIEHEEEDHRCAIEQAEQLFTCLKALGRTVELVRFEGDSHGMSRTGRPANRRERLRRIVEWFDRYMRAATGGARR